MPRVRPQPAEPDRLTAVLDEMDLPRRQVGWVPTRESLLDSRRPALQSAAAGPTRGSERAQRAQRGLRPARSDEDDPAASQIRPHAPLLRVPLALRDSQVAPGRLAVFGVLVVVLVASLVLGGRVLLSRMSTTTTPVTPAVSAKSAVTTAPGANRLAGAGTAGAPRKTPATTQVVVQVVGQVRRPGVVTLRTGSRVQDAVAATGGALPSADLAAVNLARVITDGEQIQVPRPGQAVSAPAGGSAGTSGPATGSAAGPAAGQSGGVVNLNSADVSGLEALPGVGPVLAGRIIDWRTKN
ncbi:MAG: SLBB domain-containing protein, partial [Allobranchiibius sp.]